MTREELQHKATCLSESLLSALDAREAARHSGSTMLVYIADLFVTRVRDELVDVQAAVTDPRQGGVSRA